jgi:hypothetical protein
MLVPSNSPLILPLPELSDIQPITDTDTLTETIVPDLLNGANDAPFSLPSSPTSSSP